MSQHVFIAGGSSGIGLASARRLAALGYKVTIAGRDARKLDAALLSLTGDVTGLVMDAADKAAIEVALAKAGPLDHLVLALGSGRGAGPFATVDVEEIRQGFGQKVFPHIALAQAALPQLARSGSLTFLSAVSAQAALPGTAGLAAANAAIAALVPILAVELRPLRVNAVSPGVIETPWWDFAPAEQRAAIFADFAARTPVGRIGQPDDVAEAIAFLIGNSFMNGHLLICDGGLRLTT